MRGVVLLDLFIRRRSQPHHHGSWSPVGRARGRTQLEARLCMDSGRDRQTDRETKLTMTVTLMTWLMDHPVHAVMSAGQQVCSGAILFSVEIKWQSARRESGAGAMWNIGRKSVMSRDVGRRDNTRERKRDLSASTLTLSNEPRADCISAVRSTARFVALGSVTVLRVGFFFVPSRW